MFAQMVQAEKDCKIPSYMVPKCPVCGGPMAMNLRCDQYFVEDEQWNEAAENYGKYLKQLKKARLYCWSWALVLTHHLLFAFLLKKWYVSTKIQS